MKNKITSVINLVISVFVLTAINTFFKPCQGKWKWAAATA